MLKLDEFKKALLSKEKVQAPLLSKEELALVQGGRKRYFIGDDEVSEATYKAFVECATGSPSQN